MHERTNIRLNAADRSQLETVVANRNSPQKHVWRAKIILLTANGHGTAEIMQATGKAKTVIWRWQERFRDEGAVGLWRDKTRRSRIPPLSPEVAKRVVALTLAGPPPAASHWSGSAMAKAAGISISSVQRIWRAHGLQPHRVRQFKLSNVLGLRPNCTTSLASTSIRLTTPLSCLSMRRAKFRHLIAPNRVCR